MPIQKANSKRKKPLKILLYGSSGVGKTHFALQATPGKTLIFDAESGSDLFEGRKGFEFDYWTNDEGQKTASIKELNKAIDYLETSEGIKNYDTLIIDPISDIWDNLQAQRSDYKDAILKTKGYGSKVDNRSEASLESFTMKDWADVKKIYKTLFLRLKNLSQNVILIAREKELTETKPNGDVIKLGEYIPEAEKNTIYAVDFAIRLTYNEATGERLGQVVKSRGEGLEKGTVYKNPTFEIFDELINGMSNGKNVEKMDSKDENLFIESEIEIPELQQKIIDKATELGGSKNQSVLDVMTANGIKNPKNCSKKDILIKTLEALNSIGK